MKTFCITLLLAFLQLNNAYNLVDQSRFVFWEYGKSIEVGDIPYQLVLSVKSSHTGKYFCGAALISATQAITAAHCLEDDILPENIRVHAGIIERSTSSSEKQTVDVKKIVMHPKFKESLNDYDIAVLTFKTPFELNEIVQPIALNTDEDATFAGENCFVSGWSETLFGSDYDQKHLKRVSMSVLSDSECLKNTYEHDESVTDSSKICAHPARFDSCVGEGGSPMVCMQNGKLILAGVTTDGYKNPLMFLCHPSSRVFYTRVSSVQDFIQENMDN